MRSRGTSDPKTSPGAVALHTAAAGPEGSALRAKYTQGVMVKGTRSKAGGNSGKVGRAYRRYMRMHGGGQISQEEKARRVAQSAAAVKARSEE